MRCSETREPSLMAHNLQTKVYALLRDAFKDSRVSSSILSARVSDANMQSHRRDYIHEMGYEPKSTTTVTTPLDPNIVYSQEDCPAEVDVDLRAQVWTEHGKIIHLAVCSRPDLAHAVSVLGRYVHNPCQKLWLAYHRIAKYLIRTKDFRLIFGTYDPLRRTEPYGFTDSDWAADLDHPS